MYLLYEQPDNWAMPTNYSTVNPPGSFEPRIGFQMADFQAAAGLNDPIAANYVRVLNGNSQQSSSSYSMTSISSTNSVLSAIASATASASASTSAAAASSAGRLMLARSALTWNHLSTAAVGGILYMIL